MKLSYGNADFHKIIKQKYCYIDRTDRITQLETEGDSLLFLRPRRFGKSLLLSTLENYYDIAKAAEFEDLFGSLRIGQNPTPLHNQYMILRWDFFRIDYDRGINPYTTIPPIIVIMIPAIFVNYVQRPERG